MPCRGLQAPGAVHSARAWHPAHSTTATARRAFLERQEREARGPQSLVSLANLQLLAGGARELGDELTSKEALDVPKTAVRF